MNNTTTLLDFFKKDPFSPPPSLQSLGERGGERKGAGPKGASLPLSALPSIGQERGGGKMEGEPLPQSYWISAFVCGEGCFTSSCLLDKRATWGIWPQTEFNITQSNKDLAILMAIQQYFGCGSVHEKGQTGIYQYSVRNNGDIKDIIIPYFEKYPLIGTKLVAFKIWCQIVNLVTDKKHVGTTLDTRNHLIKALLLMQQLNAKDLSLINANNTIVGVSPSIIYKRKLSRNEALIFWLNSLTKTPTSLEKEVIINQFKRKKSLGPLL